MKYILSNSNDPYFNLAAEEFLLKNYTEDIYFQYVNHDAVVIGKHQNTLAEIDLEFLLKNDVHLARRISGGGAVFHDKGNMNYSFMTTEKPGDYIRFGTYTAPIISALNALDSQAYLGKRNEILSGNRKISGTASHVFKSRVLHHGTLLFDADLNKLSRCLYVKQGRYHDKAVKSVRSEVTNIHTILKEKMDAASFYDFVFQYILKNFRDGEMMNLPKSDVLQIEKLRVEKFATWDWNYGYSPRYEMEREIYLEGINVKVHTVVNKGIIQEINFSGIIDQQLDTVRKGLEGLAHNRSQIENRLSEIIADEDLRLKIVPALF